MILPFATMSCVHRGFHLLWGVHLAGLLLAPKLLQEHGFLESFYSWRKQQPAALQGLTGLLLSPVLDLCSLAAVPSVWLPQVRRYHVSHLSGGWPSSTSHGEACSDVLGTCILLMP